MPKLHRILVTAIMQDKLDEHWVSLDTSTSIWPHFFTVAPLVVIGTKEGEGYDLAPKHMVTALGHDNYFGFVCTSEHATYHNVLQYKEFSVSFPQPKQVVLASFAAMPRKQEESMDKPIVNSLPTVHAQQIDALFVQDSYLFLECKLDRIIDDFGKNSLITGHIIAAHVHQDAYRASEKDEAAMIYDMPLLAYIAYGRFAEIRKTQAFPFPKDFSHFK